MSEYGLKIKNFQAGSLYDYNLGIRDNYDYTNAMLTNSLFSDFMIENGMSVWNGESTRDIICIDFKYGSRSYTDEIKHLNKIAINSRLEYKIAKSKKDKVLIQQKFNKRKRVSELYYNATQNENRYDKKARNEIRTLFYTKGVDIEYNSYNKKGKRIKTETIHYKMLYRTPGKAKKGSCMFINEKLYEKARNFLYMGIVLQIHNAPIVEIGAYSSLITSSIVGKIKINPKNILVINDVEAFFKTNIISVELDPEGHCAAIHKDNYELKNTLFDGQALIDSSIFPEWGNGYVLLRHHFCKMAAFCSNIQKFFKDYYGENYYNATVKDMWGNDHFVKDIELITTDNAMKWLKFDITYDYWCNRVYENDCMFGIVKTAHKSKLGRVQRMSYQMINSLDTQIMDSVMECSINYIEKIKTDDNAFLDYLRDNINFSNDFEVLIALCEYNPEFTRSEYFRDRKRKIIESYVLNLKNGRAIQNADNLVIIGSPYAMLLAAVGDNPYSDDTFNVEQGTIQCYTERFQDGEYLAEFRSPFNSKNNMGYLHNVYNDKFKKYFVFGEQIIAINMIGTDFQDRNNGSDQDSDSIYTTNQRDIVEYAKHCYLNYPTIVNNIPKEKNHYDNTLDNFATIDNNLMEAQDAIGQSSNLAQIDLTYTYNFPDKKYQDYVCIFSVLAQVAIDNAKRRFAIDLSKEIKLLKNEMDLSINKYPVFWTVIRKGFNKVHEQYEKELKEIKRTQKIPYKYRRSFNDIDELIIWLEDKSDKTNKINTDLKCPMNCIYNYKIKEFKPSTSTLPMGYFFNSFELEEHRRKSKKVEELIQKYSFDLYSNYQKLSSISGTGIMDSETSEENYLLLRSDFDNLIEDIKSTYLSKNYIGLISWLLNRAFCISSGAKRNTNNTKSKTDQNKAILLKVLYEINSEALLRCLSNNLLKKVDT